MVGSLVDVLPTQHEGGQLVLRQGRQEWTINLASKITAETEPSVCFVAFFGDVEHEVLPIISGYRATLTYNLYHHPSHPSASHIPTPLHDRVKKALVNLINDRSTLPEGGYLGFGLVHEYVYNEKQPINVLIDHLKGADLILATICQELGLFHSLKLLYRNLSGEDIYFITDRELPFNDFTLCEGEEKDSRSVIFASLTIDNAEGVEIIGQPFDREVLGGHNLLFRRVLQPFYRDPVTQVLEIREMSSVATESPYVWFGNEAILERAYGQACMLIKIDPVGSRENLVP